MLYLIQSLFINNFGTLRVFKSIMFRASTAFIVAFLFMLILGKPFIQWLKVKKYGDTAREVGPKSHFDKSGTPTMGGLLIIGAILFATLIAGNFTNKFIVFLFIITILFTTIGFYDDYLKLTRNKNGLSGKKKIAGQLIITALTFFFVYKFGLINKEIDFSIVNPVFKNSYFYITPVLFFVFMALVIIGSSNAVNLTDGLDGLAIMPTALVAGAFALIAWATGNVNFAEYLHIPYIKYSSEVVVFCTAIVGAGLGFLWFNTYPAQVFMGDVGSLALGGALGVVAILVRQEFLLVIMGGVFVVEALSVILQVGSYKLRKQRIFRMAPIHHHFELKGWPEPRVIIRFWIISLMLVLMGLVTLKLR